MSQVVVGVLSRTKRERVLDGATRVLVGVSVLGSTGLVPGFAAYPSSTTVESEQVGVLAVVREGMTRLSFDEDVVEGETDVRSGLC